ncbi:MAG: DHH family phosphoesterase [Candidatus Rifleibacteriota bacterium]
MQYSNIVPDELKPDADKIIEKINNSRTFLLSSHVRPDGDAIGSVAGLCKSLSKAGKQVEVALLDGVPNQFAFAFPEVKLYKTDRIDSDHDLIIVLDAGDETRSGIKFKPTVDHKNLINIDHHASNNYFGDMNLVDTSASSTCEMITGLLSYAGLPIDKDIALSLMLGLITDSRSFQNEGIRPETHLAAACLLETGMDKSPIMNMLNSNRSEADLRVQGFGLANFKLECDNRLSTLVITQKDLKKLNAGIKNIFASGIFNIPLSMKSTKASLVIFEREDGMSFCEFRSRGGIDVKEVAVSMGGGGHVPASGCSREIPIEELAREAIEKMKSQVNKSIKRNSA